MTPAQAQIGAAFRELNRLLKARRLPDENGAERFTTANEFMLMSVDGPVNAFKHTHSRRYLYVRNGRLEVPAAFFVC